MTSSPGLQQLREGREAAIAKAIKEESKEKGSGAGDLFTAPKTKKPTKLTSPTLDFVMDHRSLIVLLESDTLDKVFTKIVEDCYVM